MGWFGRLLNRRRGTDPAHHERWVLPYLPSGFRLTPDEALSLSAVWACIDAIAKAIASCRWNIYLPRGNGRRELLEDDALAWVLNTRPNPDMTAIAFREAMLYTCIPFGNAYAEIVRDGAGRVVELWPLEADRVTPRRARDTWQFTYEYRQPDGDLVVLSPRDVYHLRGPGLNGLLGDNLIARAAKSLSVAAAQERHSATYFGQGASPTGVLKFPGKLGQEAFDRLRAQWDDKSKQGDKAHRPLILEAGMEWVSVSTEPQKSQLVESRQFSVEEICRWFGVPPHKVQHLLRATYSNIEHSSMEFVRDALTPWCRRLEQEADYKLFRQDRGPWRYTSLDTAPLSYGDAYSRAQAHAVWRQNGVMSANEIRAREGLNDAGPDGDVLLVQSNMTTIEALLNPPEPPPALAPGVPPEGDDEELNPSVEASRVASEAVERMFASALERYAGRTRNGGTTAGHRLWLVSECESFAPFAIKAFGRSLSLVEVLEAAALVDGGNEPVLAVGKVLSTARVKLSA